MARAIVVHTDDGQSTDEGVVALLPGSLPDPFEGVVLDVSSDGSLRGPKMLG
jgi:hypothetical protein